MEKIDRRLEWKGGATLKVGGREYEIFALTASEGGGFKVLLKGTRFQSPEYRVPGRVSGFFDEFDGKPYTYLDDLQDALDLLEIESVMVA